MTETDYSRIAELHINKADETVGIYGFAFLDAAAKVFAEGMCDFAPYPGMYCLRHGLELFIKQVAVYQAYELRRGSLLYRKGHGLLELWEQVKPYVDDCLRESAEVNSDALARLDDAIRDIHDVDPGGMLYRYPEDIVRNRGRIDTHFPDNRFDLNLWKNRAELLLADCQSIEYELGERCSFLRHRRKEYGSSVYDLVAVLPEVRRFTLDDLPLYRRLRLKSLKESPDAFGSTHEAEAAQGEKEWSVRLEGGVTSEDARPMVGLLAGEPVGLSWGKMDPEEPNMAQLFQMWVAPEARGKGTGTALLQDAIDWTRNKGGQSIRLWVTSGDSAAAQLYAGAGFVAVGDAEPLREGSSLTSQQMILRL